MNGQMKYCNSQKRSVDEFIKRVNPYEKCGNVKVNFDIRSYVAYLKENNISGKNVSDEILRKFVK